MSNQESAEIRMQISSINACCKQPSVSFMMPNPPIPKMPEIEPDYVGLNLIPLVDELHHHGASAIIRKDDIKRLNLMVGDTVTLKITKS
jgi:hypothetical protein